MATPFSEKHADTPHKTNTKKTPAKNCNRTPLHSD